MAQRTRLPAGLHGPIAVVILIAIYVLLDAALLRIVDPGSDWGPLWSGGRMILSDPARIYDFSAITLMQEPLLAPGTARPFIYPPTTLILLVPLGLLPFRLSFALFVAASALLFERASAKLSARPAMLLVAPPVVLAALAGQPTLLVIALALAALCLLPNDERLAGALFGVAAAIKPPLLFLVPLALIAGGHRRALLSAAAAASLLVLLSVALFGLQPWHDWFRALPGFQAVVAGFEPLLRKTVTPYGTAIRLGLNGAAVLVATAPAALLLVFLAFRKSSDIAVRLTALVGGTLLVSPYAMDYELAAFAPAIAAIRIRGLRDIIVPTIWAASLFFNVSVLGLFAVCGWATAKLFTDSRQPATISRCSSGSILPPDSTATVASSG